LENFRLYLALGFTALCTYLAVLLGTHRSPAFLWLLVPGAGGGVLAYVERLRLQRRKALTRLRAEWGVEKLKQKRDVQDASALFQVAPQPSTALDDRTWQDLTMDLIFAKIDRTLTWPGCQRLYQLLRTPQLGNLQELDTRRDMLSGFETDAAVREEVHLILSGMDARIGAGLCTLLWDLPQVRPVHPPLLYQLMFGLAVLSPFLILLSPQAALIPIFVFQINMYLHFKVQKQIRAYFEGVRSLRQLISAARKLAKLEGAFLQEKLAEIREALVQVEGFTKLVRFVGVEATDPLTNTILQYSTIFFLREVRGFFKALRFIAAHQQALQSLFLAVGDLDALQAAASYRASLDYYCEPEFTKKKQLHLEGAYHPLLLEPVPNSITVQDQGILITGSNMSGKSTFLRTVGVNALLAQTIATCPARVYRGCPVQLKTSIGRADNVVEGKSYYLEEALSVLRIIKAVNNDWVTLAIFDELYRGTNSEERIFAARQVLEYLVQRNVLVLAATHDLELTELLQETYDSWHFSEKVGELGLEFDYKLKKGPALTRNAIALLRHLGYPQEITDGKN
jgi:hypothetical protein